jgi:hypothetical protein
MSEGLRGLPKGKVSKHQSRAPCVQERLIGGILSTKTLDMRANADPHQGSAAVIVQLASYRAWRCTTGQSNTGVSDGPRKHRCNAGNAEISEGEVQKQHFV